MKRKAEALTQSAAELFGLSGRKLLLGEGNFSFSWALCQLTTGAELTSSCFESCEQHRQRFQASEAREQQLRGRGVRVLHGVDATDLKTLPSDVITPFDRIIFQFPQHPERNKIHLNRELLAAFLKQSEALLAEKGEVVVSLLRGQGGTPFELEERRPKDTWQVQELAMEAGLLLVRVTSFPEAELATLGYQRTGFRGQGLHGSTKEVYQERGFNSEGSLTHCFARPGDGVTAACPIERRHDISFWVVDPKFSEDLLRRSFPEEFCPQVTLLDEYRSPQDGREARTYRLSVSSSTCCITQGDWKQICEKFRQRLWQDPSVEPRRGREAEQSTVAARGSQGREIWPQIVDQLD
ncbi:unnamed protein product [Effrenium voratum]|nr:unnamed protein product [Effrenium voratum]